MKFRSQGPEGVFGADSLGSKRRFQEQKSEVEVGAYREALFALTPPIIYQVRSIADFF